MNFGVIGMSEGNGHPYSWSAILNGYNTQHMATCPFSAIPDYLGKQKYPDDFITGHEVTHIWTQEDSISNHIAQASKIKAIVKEPQDMIGQIDALLLARDDYENHMHFAKDFLKMGIPVYIDKPIANYQKDAKLLYDLQQFETQIFSCSAVRYAQELEPLRDKIKDIKSINAHTPKYWSTYAMHIIDPIVGLLGSDTIVLKDKKINGEAVIVSIQFGDVAVTLQSAGEAIGTINFVIEYHSGEIEEIIIKNSFYAFRAALNAFIQQIESKKAVIPMQQIMDTVSIIEMGKAK